MYINHYRAGRVVGRVLAKSAQDMSSPTLIMTLLGRRLSFPLSRSIAARQFPSVPPTLSPILLIVKLDEIVSVACYLLDPSHPDLNATLKPS